MDTFELGSFLKKEREKQHLSSRKLAERTKSSVGDKGVSASHINKIETGKVNPNFQTLQKLALALGLKLVIILDGGKAAPDVVTILSTAEVAGSLPQAFNRKELVELLLACQELTDEQIRSLSGVARSMDISAD